MQQSIHARAIDGILDDVFRQYRNYFVPLMLVSLIFMGPYAILNAWAGSLTPSIDYIKLLQGQGGFNQLLLQMQHLGAASSTASYYTLSGILFLLSAFIVTPMTQGAYFFIGTETLTEPHIGSISFYIRRAFKRWGAYVATVLLMSFLIVFVLIFAVAIFAGIFFLLKMFLPSSGGVVFVLIAGLLYIVMLCVLLWITIRLNFVYVTVFVEKKRNWGAIKRSWILTSGSFWRILGISLLAGLVLMFASLGLSALINLFLTGTVRLLATGLIGILLAPLFELLIANLYVDLRVRKEGYDIEWMTKRKET